MEKNWQNENGGKISTVLIYAGTTEGRELSQILAEHGINCDVCVATEYGKQVMHEIQMNDSKFIRILQGRLDCGQMQELYSKNNYDLIIDATHPFAQLVSENIKKSVETYKGKRISLYRLARDVENNSNNSTLRKYSTVQEPSTINEYSAVQGYSTINEYSAVQGPSTVNECSTIQECVSMLAHTSGNILLTTGSKELAQFCQNEHLRRRLIVRVLPGLESISLCYENGLEGKQIIAMQGPFSEEMNISLIHQYDIKHLVTKESGKIGGVDEKISAAAATGTDVYMIKRPALQIYNREYSMKQILEMIFGETDTALSKCSQMNITLVGIGMGNIDFMTENVKKAILNADLVFGAKRMIESVYKFINSEALVYPYYLAKDIVPVLVKYKNQKHNAVVLFSGDTGFYSGTKKLTDEIKKMSDINVSILPGISSIQAFAARLGTSWDDAVILSAHGTAKTRWMSQIRFYTRNSNKVFFITSGADDIRDVAEMLKDEGNFRIYAGYQLSYEDEEIFEINSDNVENINKDGLYVGMIINSKPKGRVLSPVLKDDDFIRDRVPMTKEEIRQLSICKLELVENSVLYDVGCGTGSISVEAASLSPDIDVYAIETNPVAVELTKENCKNHNLSNITVIESLAPAGFENLPVPTHVFIGGSKGNLQQIMDALIAKKSVMRVVINAVSLETIAEVTQVLNGYGILDIDVVCVNVSKAKKLGGYHLMQANNPVYIISFNIC